MEDRLELLTRVARDERGVLIAAARAEGLRPEEAVEVVQDALCTFLSAAPSEGAPVRATLITMVRHAAKNARRRHHRALPHVPLDDDASPSEARDAESLLAHAEDVVRLSACVTELCGIQRAVVMLRLLDERSGQDVATELGISRNHVDVLVHRAKAALRVCMRVRD